MSRDSSRRTYAEALEGLGGEPWKKFNGTEQWFLIDEAEARGDDDARPRTGEARPASIDEARPASIDEARPATIDEFRPPTFDEARPPINDTAQFRIPKPTLAEWLQRRLVWLTLGGFALTGIVVAAALPTASLAAQPTVIVTVAQPLPAVRAPAQAALAPIAPAPIAPAPIAPAPIAPAPAPIQPARLAPPAQVAMAAPAPAAHKKLKKRPRRRARR